MKILKPTLVLLLILLQACKAKKVDENNFDTQLSVFQNNKERSIHHVSKTIKIDKKPFSLRFYNKKYDLQNEKLYVAQIAAFLDQSELDKVKIGHAKTELPCFASGTGIAANRNGKYNYLYFNNRGHHYTYYENSESKRLNLLEDSENLLRLEFEINALLYNTKKVKMTETDLEQFYLAFFIDKNLNGIIDKGELNKLTITF